MIHLYAVVEELEALPPGCGIEGAPPELRRAAGLDAIVSFHEQETEPDEDAVLAHAEIVEQAMERSSAILPARFARGFPNLEALESSLASMRDELLALLPRVRGCVELGIRVFAPEDRAGRQPRPSGAEYMRTLLDELRTVEALADDLHHTLAEAARESGRAETGTGGFLLSSVYLVPRHDVRAFRARVRDLERAHPDLGVVCTGPWPPYSFATLAASVDVGA